MLSFRFTPRASIFGFALVAICLIVSPVSADQNIGTQPQPASPGERRLVVWMFDLSSPESETRQAMSDALAQFGTMPSTDLVAVVTVGTRVNVISDFTSNPDELRKAASQALAMTPSSLATADPSTDPRLRGIRSVCESIAPIPARKMILYFSSGIQGDKSTGDVWRGAVSTCSSSNVTLYPIDHRALARAVAPPQ